MKPATAKPAASVTFEEVRQLVRNDFPRLETMQPDAALGDFAPARLWLSQAQGRQKPTLRHPRLALFIAAHGARPELQQDLLLTLEKLEKTQHPAAALAQEANADLQVYELDIAAPSRDFAQGPALGEEEAAHALTYGMMAVQPGVDLAAVALLNPVADIAGVEIGKALGSGTEPFAALLRFGGLDIAAALGCLVAARLARIPVMTEGAGTRAAAAILEALHPAGADHCRDVDTLFPQAAALPPGGKSALFLPLLKSLARI